MMSKPSATPSSSLTPFVLHVRVALGHDLTWRGDFPTNTHGGQLSFGQPGMAGGMSHVTEAARQVMGACDGRQVRACDVAYVNGNGGFLSEQVSLVLARAL